MKGGQTSEAMEDFTGGMTESFDLGQKAPKNLFTIMCKAHQRQSLMGCSINVSTKCDYDLILSQQPFQANCIHGLAFHLTL